jgi:hypothetical protein
MSNVAWAHVTNGVVDEILSLDASITPGVNLFTPSFAAGMINVSSVSPAPQVGWSYNGSAFAAPPGPTLGQLQAQTIAAAQAAAAQVVGQIYPDPVHQTAGQNAAMIAAVSGGAPASASPFYAEFGAYASIYGVTPAALATLAVALINQSLSLSAALLTLQGAASAATAPSALATALATFETAIGAIVAAVNAAAPPAPMVAPTAISIPGVNA